MILFLEDWEKYPSAIIDTKTSNTSWVRLAGLYKAMGIKNHAFPLALINPKLQGIDPYDPDLPEDILIAIGIEAKLNPWYYFREILRLPPPAGSIPLKFKANRANIATIWLSLNHITSYLIQPRQTGKSATGDGIESYMANTKASNTEISILTKDEKLRTRNSRRLKDLLESLPEHMRMISKRDVKNNEKITIKALNNVINFYLGQKDRKAADNVGRGMTSPIAHIDEFAYIYNIDVILPVMLAATTAAREVAKEVGAPYFTLFTTTPGKLNTREGRFAYDVYKNSLRWSEKFLDLKNQEELQEIVNKNTRKYRVVLLEFNHRQLGYTDGWLKERMMESFSEGANAESDYLNKWVAGNMSNPIPKKILEIIKKSEKKPDPQTYKYGYIINWYITESEKIKYARGMKHMVIGLDTSDALGGNNDDIGLVIRDVETGEVIGAGKYNETNLAIFADFLVSVLEAYPTSIFIPERKSSATAILDNMYTIMLTKSMNPYKRIFNWLVNNGNLNDKKLLQILEHPTIENLTKNKRYFGFATSSSGESSRGLLYGNVFRSSYNYTGDKVHDKDLIEQLSSLRVVNGKIDHEEGGHDDLVIAWLLTYWFLQYGKNKKWYGMDEHKVLVNLNNLQLMVENEGLDPEYVRKQEKLKEEIEAYIKTLRGVTDEIIALRLLNKIMFLSSKLDFKVIRNFNLESILNDIKIYKRVKSILKKKKETTGLF